MKEKITRIPYEEQVKIYEIISQESFPIENIYFSEDFMYIDGVIPHAKGRVCVDGKTYLFFWTLKYGILVYTIDLIEYEK